MRNCDENGESGSDEQKEEEKNICRSAFHTSPTRPYIRVGLFSMRMDVWRNIHGFVDHAGVRHSFIAMCQFLQHEF